MTGDALATLARARRLGVAVEIRSGRLWAGPAARLPADLLADLRRNKADVLRALVLLAPRPEPPAAEPSVDTAPAPAGMMTPEQAEAEWRRFWSTAVVTEPGVFRDPRARDAEARAAIEAGRGERECWTPTADEYERSIRAVTAWNEWTGNRR